MHGFPQWPTSLCSCYDYMMWNTTTETHISLACFNCISSTQRTTSSLSTGKWSLLAIRGHYAHQASGQGGKNYSQWRKNAGHYETMDFTIHCIISARGPCGSYFSVCFTSIVITPLTAWSSVVIKIPSRRQARSLFRTFELRWCIFPSPLLSMWSEVQGGKIAR